MPKRVSDAERILMYFKTADLGQAELMLQFCTAEVKSRKSKPMPIAVPHPTGSAVVAPQKRGRKAQANPEPVAMDLPQAAEENANDKSSDSEYLL